MELPVRPLLIAVALLTAMVPAGAQIGRPRMSFGQPSAYASLGVGVTQPFAVNDGTTDSRWMFGDATQFAASLERAVGTDVSFGLRGTTARVPLSYTSGMSGVRTTTEADANVSQLFATLHVANGGQLHSVLELGAGATMYSSFSARGTGAKLPPAGADVDFSFAFGYGLGYSFNRSLTVDVVQDIATSLHQGTGLAAGESTSARLHATRIVARFALGG